MALALFLGSCTAIKVVTHATSGDPADAPKGVYSLDPHHWSLIFDVDHLRYSRVVMRFDQAHASLVFQPDEPERSVVMAVIDAASLDTNVAELDRLVMGPEMLDAAHYPEIRFVSRALRRSGDNRGDMTGDLTLHGETREVTLAVIFNGEAPNPLTGEDTLGFTATGHFDRSSFGLGTWYPAVGNEVQIMIQAEFVKSRGDS
jgi:polyisoprenoid-binding protein YceI